MMKSAGNEIVWKWEMIECPGEKVYEDVERLLQRASTRRGRPEAFERNAPERRSVIMDVFGKSGSLHRALWCEMPEVRVHSVNS